MSTVRLKDEGEKIVMIGRETITSQNLTVEKYKTLIAEYPALAEKFEFVYDEEDSDDKQTDSSTANNE